MTNFRSLADILLLLGRVLGHPSSLRPTRPPEPSKHPQASHPSLEVYRGPEVLDVTRRVEGAFLELRLEQDCLKKALWPQTESLVVLHDIRGRFGKLECAAAPEAARIKDLAAASDAVAEIHAGYDVAGAAFKVILLAVFGLDEIVPGAVEQRVAASAAGQPRAGSLSYVLRNFNLEFALISHYGE